MLNRLTKKAPKGFLVTCVVIHTTASDVLQVLCLVRVRTIYLRLDPLRRIPDPMDYIL